jgi:hypothetical protein
MNFFIYFCFDTENKDADFKTRLTPHPLYSIPTFTSKIFVKKREGLNSVLVTLFFVLSIFVFIIVGTLVMNKMKMTLPFNFRPKFDENSHRYP